MDDRLPTDADLVQRCLAGHASAWEVLTARYSDVIYGVAWRSGLRGDVAADVVQEVFVALLGHLPRLRDKDRLLAWILTTARREAWRQGKQARLARTRERKKARGEEADDRLPDAELAALEEEQAVRTAFARLGERCRRLLDALFFQKPARPYGTIAAELGIPMGSLGPTRRRCLDALKGELAREGFSSPDDVSDEESGPSWGVKSRKRP